MIKGRYILDLLIRYGVPIVVLLIALANILMGLGLGPFSFNPINIASGVVLAVIVLAYAGRR